MLLMLMSIFYFYDRKVLLYSAHQIFSKKNPFVVPTYHEDFCIISYLEIIKEKKQLKKVGRFL